MTFGRELDQPATGGAGCGPQTRIACPGPLDELLDMALAEYDQGTLVSFDVKQNGYEDFNVVVRTSQTAVFAKFFADWRTEQECRRYLRMITAARDDGVRTPAVLPNSTGLTLTTVVIDEATVRLCLMTFLDGGNVWESGRRLSASELMEVARQAARINASGYRPPSVHDSWAIPHLAQSYARNRHRIDHEDQLLIEPLIQKLERLDMAALPTTFVHGDLRSTNVMRHSDGQVYVIDFSVANVYPAVVELAVLGSDLCFDPERPEKFPVTFAVVLDAYRSAGGRLTSDEVALLPLFVGLGHAANVVGAASADAEAYISDQETNHWRDLGRVGLRCTVT